MLALAVTVTCSAVLGVVFLMRRTATCVPATAFPSPGSRTVVTGIAATTLLVTLVSAVVLLGSSGAAISPHAGSRVPTIVALDLSGSMIALQGAKLRRAVEGIADRFPGRAGMVIFADEAATILPPSAPTAELVRLSRFFASAPRIPNEPIVIDSLGEYITVAPWVSTFAGGTVIASGLDRARALIEQSGATRGRIVLVSDLDDSDPDGSFRPAMTRARRAGIDVMAVPVVAPRAALARFRQFGGSVLDVRTRPAPEQSSPTSRTWLRDLRVAGLALFAVLAGLLLAATHAWGSPISLGPVAASGREA